MTSTLPLFSRGTAALLAQPIALDPEVVRTLAEVLILWHKALGPPLGTALVAAMPEGELLAQQLADPVMNEDFLVSFFSWILKLFGWFPGLSSRGFPWFSRLFELARV